MMDLAQLLAARGIDPRSPDTRVAPFLCEEDGEPYQVWRIASPAGSWVLKRAKAYELEVYARFLGGLDRGVPRCFGAARQGEADYLLLEDVAGTSLRRASRPGLERALEALIFLQESFWENTSLAGAGYSFPLSLKDRQGRGRWLGDPLLERVYQTYLSLYRSLPRTLCHDDLLPTNVLVSPERAVLIDWEFGGILPYLTPLARLIAHGEDREDAFFYLTGADRDFAIGYYYRRFAQRKGIGYPDYRRALAYFLLYEYCEWIMVGHQSGQPDSPRCRAYTEKALALARRLEAGLYELDESSG